MTSQEIDHLTEKFYESISFNAEHYPNIDQLQELFYGSGILINNNFEKPVDFTLQTFAHAMMSQIEGGNAIHLAQQEISDTTHIFGNIAQRISVYEYNSSPQPSQNWKRGVNFIQFIYSEGKWLIVSMIWKDETEETPIPSEFIDL